MNFMDKVIYLVVVVYLSQLNFVVYYLLSV